MSRFLKDTKKYYKYAIYSAKSKLQSEVASSYLNWLLFLFYDMCSFIFNSRNHVCFFSKHCSKNGRYIC